MKTDYDETDDKRLAEWLGLPVRPPDELVDPKTNTWLRGDPIKYLTAPTPKSDYRVLEAVRRWRDNGTDEQAMCALAFECGIKGTLKGSWHPLGYFVGDFAKAAFAVMEESQ